jgi:hypothetical protein
MIVGAARGWRLGLADCAEPKEPRGFCAVGRAAPLVALEAQPAPSGTDMNARHHRHTPSPATARHGAANAWTPMGALLCSTGWWPISAEGRALLDEIFSPKG